MICSFLVHCGATAEEAIQLYGQKRTLDGCVSLAAMFLSSNRDVHDVLVTSLVLIDLSFLLYDEHLFLCGFQGVTIPSQLRYIRYYEQFLESRTLNYDPRLLVLQELVIDTIPKPLLNVEPLSKYLILTIMSSDVKIYESVPQHVRCLFC